MKYLLVIALLVAARVPAVADARTEAQLHIDKAMVHHQEGRFKDALDELLFAYSLHPRPDLLYAIAQVQVKLGDCPQAITFYERFLTTHPDAGPATAAREAIDVCKTNPPVVEPIKPPDPETPPELPKPPPEQPEVSTQPAGPTTTTTTTRPFYTDKLGDALLGGGVAFGLVGFAMYRGALGDLDDADAAENYARHVELVESAHSKRTIATVMGIGGVALIGAGIARFVLGDRTTTEPHRLAITPTADGGLVTWSGHFR